MEQHRTRPPQSGRTGQSAQPGRPSRTGRSEPRRVPPLPPQAGRDSPARPDGPPRPAPPRARSAGSGPARDRAPQRRPAALRRPAPPPATTPARRFPDPRLTGLGAGLFCTAVMLTLAFLIGLLFDSSVTVYGVLFLPVCALTALWVRPGDLVTAPVVVPIAFAVGLLPIAEGDGVFPRLMGLFTALATEAGWLYGGTLIAGSIATVRKVRLMARRRAGGERRRVPTG
ncbi:DUF6542 domain-containing protein [Streptomyces sp. NPDC059477]|uniref:DUF6542 domain-containing protein n=1 Tax=Streptomyces sp. NPDC059477 TaxID=3346847 RepID=UPI003684CEEE